MSKKRRQYDDDDGRTIANMNVDGMPWYDGRSEGDNSPPREQLSVRQRASALLGVLAAVLLIAAVFGVVYFVAILLMTVIWR